jgi:hypothetical protein
MKFFAPIFAILPFFSHRNGPAGLQSLGVRKRGSEIQANADGAETLFERNFVLMELCSNGTLF